MKIIHRSGPVNYSRICIKCGSGFILSRLAVLGPSTRRQIYENSIYEKRYSDGYHSVLWKTLIEDGLIEATNSRKITTKRRSFSGYTETTEIRSYSKNSPIYQLTEYGKNILEKIKL